MKRGAFTLGLMLCCALTGCRSIRFGSILEAGHAESRTPPRAVLGNPTPAMQTTKVQQAAAQAPRLDEASQPLDLDNEPPGRLIDLSGALQRAGIANATIAYAEEVVRQRRAEEALARALLFPHLNAGANVRIHRGPLLRGNGAIIDSDLQSTYAGLGAGARGGGTVAVPGIQVVSHLADAIYAPRAARQKVVGSRSEARTTRQYTLLEVGVAYLELAGAQARLGALEQSLGEFTEIERLATNAMKAGQGRDSDAQRAKSEALLLKGQAVQVREAIRVAAAELARLLDVDPSDPLRAANATPPILELVDRAVPVTTLLQQAWAAHPEVTARAAEVSFQEILLRQERVRPWLPLVAVGFSAGDFAGSGNATGSRPGDYFARTDLDVVAVWSLQNFGAGNLAVQRISQVNVQMARLELARTLERIREEVAQAQALTEARRQDLNLARKRIETAGRAFQQDLTRARNNQGRPLETLASASQLAAARQDLVRAMVGYSQAQLQLFTALGNTP